MNISCKYLIKVKQNFTKNLKKLGRETPWLTESLQNTAIRLLMQYKLTNSYDEHFNISVMKVILGPHTAIFVPVLENIVKKLGSSKISCILSSKTFFLLKYSTVGER